METRERQEAWCAKNTNNGGLPHHHSVDMHEALGALCKAEWWLLLPLVRAWCFWHLLHLIGLLRDPQLYTVRVQRLIDEYACRPLFDADDLMVAHLPFLANVGGSSTLALLRCVQDYVGMPFHETFIARLMRSTGHMVPLRPQLRQAAQDVPRDVETCEIPVHKLVQALTCEALAEEHVHVHQLVLRDRTEHGL
jgi:hypothetical protein